jgi:hypothetical protein
LETMTYQPRYLAYCRANGKTPDEMMAHDEQAYPSGCMIGFLCWSSNQLFNARRGHPDWFLNGTLLNHAEAEYDAWLQNEAMQCNTLYNR